jgi:hypothetical protein
MRRLAATLAGLALVLIPSTIAMSSADPAAKSAQPSLAPVYYQGIQNQNGAPRMHRGRHCHRKDGTQKPQSGGGAPDV